MQTKSPAAKGGLQYPDIQICTFPIQSHSQKCTDAQKCMATWANFEGILNSILNEKRNFEIVSEYAMFEASWGKGGLGSGGGWWVVHGSEAVFGMLYSCGRRYAHCVKILFLRFLTAPVTSKLEPAEANEYLKF